MPLINHKLPEGVLTPAQTRERVERLPDTMLEIEGQNPRSVTWRVVEEVKNGDWGIAGNALTAGHVRALAAGFA